MNLVKKKEMTEGSISELKIHQYKLPNLKTEREQLLKKLTKIQKQQDNDDNNKNLTLISLVAQNKSAQLKYI